MRCYCHRITTIPDNQGHFQVEPTGRLWWVTTPDGGETVVAETRDQAKAIFQSTHDGVRWCSSYS